MNKTPEHPHVILIAAPKGAGKTTLAQEDLPNEAKKRVGEVVGGRP
jgi:uridine kinase